MVNTCKNCGQETKGNFCSNCGQSTHTHRVNLHHLVHEFLHGILHIDKGIFFTIKELTIRPGQTLRNYLGGKRVNYFKPFGYIFMIATVYTLIMHFVDIPIINADSVLEVIHSSQDPQEIEHRETVVEMNDTLHFFYSWVNERYAISALLLLPLFAFISFFVFRRAKYNYGEHLVINSYIVGQSTLLLIIGIPFIYYMPSLSTWMYIFLPSTSILKLYMFFSLFNNYKTMSRISLSILCIILEYIIAWFVISIFIMAILMFKIHS